MVTTDNAINSISKLRKLMADTPGDSEAEKVRLHREVLARLTARARREMRTRNSLIKYILTAEAEWELENDGGRGYAEAVAEGISRPLRGMRLSEEQAGVVLAEVARVLRMVTVTAGVGAAPQG